jgi:predicted transcriptional regulator
MPLLPRRMHLLDTREPVRKETRIHPLALSGWSVAGIDTRFVLTLSFLRKNGGFMDRVLSTRVDESIVDRLTHLARHLRVSKKNVIERAISLLADTVEAGDKVDVLDRTFGVWQRGESAEHTVRRARAAFRQSMERHRA